jgi:hypothetical protein
MTTLKITNKNGHSLTQLRTLAVTWFFLTGVWSFWTGTGVWPSWTMLSLDAGISMKSSIGGTFDELKGRSVTKDGAKSTSPSKINLLNGTSPEINRQIC